MARGSFCTIFPNPSRILPIGRPKALGLPCALPDPMLSNNPLLEALTERVIGCGIKIHEYFGPGLL